MQGWTDAGGGVKGIDDTQHPGEHVLPRELRRAYGLDTGIENIAEHSRDLRYDDVGLQVFEAIHIVEEGISHCTRDKQIPAHIENHKALTERNHIVQTAVNHVAALRRDQILCQKIQGEIDEPAAQQPDMRKARLLQTPQRKTAVINGLSLHGLGPPGECSLDIVSSGRWDRAPQRAPAGRRPLR